LAGVKKKKKLFLNRTETKSVEIFAAGKKHAMTAAKKKKNESVASIPVDGYENRYI
jgi:hypothetical protein